MGRRCPYPRDLCSTCQSSKLMLVGQLVQKQHALVRQGDLAGARSTAGVRFSNKCDCGVHTPPVGVGICEIKCDVFSPIYCDWI